MNKTILANCRTRKLCGYPVHQSCRNVAVGIYTSLLNHSLVGLPAILTYGWRSHLYSRYVDS